MSTKQREWLLWENVKNNILQLNTYKHNNISNPTSGRNTKFRHSFFEKVGLWLFLSANAKRKKHANTSFQKRLWQSLNYLWFAAMVDTMSFWQFLRETESYSNMPSRDNWQLSYVLKLRPPIFSKCPKIILLVRDIRHYGELPAKNHWTWFLTSMTETLNLTNPVSGQIGIHIGTRYRFRFRRVDHPTTLPPIKSRSE